MECGGVPCVHLPTEDNPEVRIPLLEGLAAIDQQKGAVLICCRNGTSLGPALAIAHIMATKRLPQLQATMYVIKRKRDASPHAGAFVQLQELEGQMGLKAPKA